jgi:hypothetical protein
VLGNGTAEPPLEINDPVDAESDMRPALSQDGTTMVFGLTKRYEPGIYRPRLSRYRFVWLRINT